MKNTALILASGTGARTGLEQPKQFYKIGKKTLLEHVLTTFELHPDIDEIVVVSHPDYMDKTKELCKNFTKICSVIAGGQTRQMSSYLGVMSIEDGGNVLIHDAVRAFLNKETISTCINALCDNSAVCTAIECTDTILRVNDSGEITDVPERKRYRLAQTPQCFRVELIKEAHKLAQEKGWNVTDDCGLILASNLAKIHIIKGDFENRKITYCEDLKFAQWIWEKTLDFKKCL